MLAAPLCIHYCLATQMDVAAVSGYDLLTVYSSPALFLNIYVKHKFFLCNGYPKLIASCYYLPPGM